MTHAQVLLLPKTVLGHTEDMALNTGTVPGNPPHPPTVAFQQFQSHSMTLGPPLGISMGYRPLVTSSTLQYGPRRHRGNLMCDDGMQRKLYPAQAAAAYSPEARLHTAHPRALNRNDHPASAPHR